MQDFSGGQKKNVLIAKNLYEKAHIYIWNEPLNYINEARTLVYTFAFSW
jgi:ABC-type Mn2+/Zn2+ transport system ATPase subunit